MQMLEIYVLCKKRSKNSVIEFLDIFLPNRKCMAEDYPFPEFSDEPMYIYDDCDELIAVLEENQSECYSLYWDSTEDGDIKSAMIFFTEDGEMIAGLVALEEKTETLLKKLSNTVGGKYGFVNFDSPPPDTREEFIEVCRTSDQVRLLEGELVKKD